MFAVLIRKIIQERGESPLLTIDWIARQAVRQLRGAAQYGGALREGAEALTREQMAETQGFVGEPRRYPVPRGGELQFVRVEHLSDEEMAEQMERLRIEVEIATARALELEIWCRHRAGLREDA